MGFEAKRLNKMPLPAFWYLVATRAARRVVTLDSDGTETCAG